MSNAGSVMKTRERILVTALELFNLCGEPNVTTVDIANEMDISPGNLYYHYRNKDEIVLEIFSRFESEMREVLDISEHDLTGMVENWVYMHLIFEKIWFYRFFYRDLNNILGRDSTLNKRFNRLLNKKSKAAKTIVDTLLSEGILKASEVEVDALVNNITLTATFWLNFESVKNGGNNTDGSAQLGHGVHQVMMHIAPYLEDENRRILHELSITYLA